LILWNCIFNYGRHAYVNFVLAVQYEKYRNFVTVKYL
jgi:hypothetical protein